MIKEIFFVWIFLLIFSQLTYSQSQLQVDSMLLVLKTAKEDTNAVNLHCNLSNYYYSIGKINELKYHADKTFLISQKINFPKGTAYGYTFYGSIESDFRKSIPFFLKAAEIFKQIGEYQMYCRNLMNISNAYTICGNYDIALDYQQQCLKIAQKIDFKQMIAYSYDILADIYLEQKKPEKTIEYYNKSIEIKEKLKVPGDVEYALYHQSLAYIELKNYQKAIEILQQSVMMSIKINYYDNLADSYIALGNIYLLQKKNSEAIDYFNKGMQIATKYNLNKQIANGNNSLGEIYFILNDIKKSYECFNHALIAAEKINTQKEKLVAVKGLKKLAIQENNYKLAYHLFEKEQNIIDSSNIELSARKALQIELQLQHNNEQNLKNAEIARQKTINNFSLVVVLILLLLVALVFYGYKTKRKDNEILRQQKKEIEIQSELLSEQNNKITSSISYARRIQQAVLPNIQTVEMLFPEHFIYFSPRDIVSGDFYFIKQIRNYNIVTVVDCTGHGVPGVFMSMLGIALLNEIVMKVENISSAPVLNELRNQIKRALQQKGQVGEQQDGMDIAFCVLNTENKMMSFAGAHNPCWIFRKMENEELKIEKGKEQYSTHHSQFSILEADHQPVGIYIKEKPFSEQTFQLQTGDTFYIFSDGYHSQFGGVKKDKLKTKRFKEILAEIHHLPMNEQKEILENRFNEWKGEQEQTDDVLVVGVRV